MKIHPFITIDRVADGVERRLIDNPGFCIACGEEAEGVQAGNAQAQMRALRQEGSVWFR